VTPTAFAATAPFGTYFVRVQATNVCGAGAPSNELTLVVQPCTAAPAGPTNLRFTQSGAQVTLLWDAPAAGARPSSYVLVVGSAPGAGNLLVTNTGSMTPAFSAIAPSGTYYVRVLSANACGQSAGASNEIAVVVP
jgi:predicted phage tail protein